MNNRRRNCPKCGRWMRCGDTLCLRCDPECLECGRRESDLGESFRSGMCIGTCFTPAAESYRQNEATRRARS